MDYSYSTSKYVAVTVRGCARLLTSKKIKKRPSSALFALSTIILAAGGGSSYFRCA